MREKEKLLDLLDDADVIKKIKKIVQNTDDAVYQNKSNGGFYNESDLRMKIEQTRKECEAEASRKLEEIQQKYVALLSQMQSELNRAKDIAKEYEYLKNQTEEKYREAEMIYAIYSSLDDTQMKWFDRVLHGDDSRTDSPIALIVWATQKENLISMWEIITSHMAEIMDNNQSETFYTLFEACFHLYATTTRGKTFLITPRVGMEYDPLIHIKTADSRSSGRITKVIFPGYCIGNENNKPIVKVE